MNVTWPRPPEATISRACWKCGQLRCCMPVCTTRFESATALSSGSPSSDRNERDLAQAARGHDLARLLEVRPTALLHAGLHHALRIGDSAEQRFAFLRSE